DFLYRVEHMQIGVGARVLLQSALPPQISATSSSLTLLASKAVNYQGVQPQQRLRFYLTANVVKKLQGNRIPLIKEAQKLNWLHRKLTPAAVLQDVHVRQSETRYFYKNATGAGKIVTSTFEGILQVQHPQQFIQLITCGIGPAKAFGCGLLSVAP